LIPLTTLSIGCPFRKKTDEAPEESANLGNFQAANQTPVLLFHGKGRNLSIFLPRNETGR
jgi:hypothetical protein